MNIASLSNKDQPMIRAFLAEDVTSNLYLLDLLDRQGIDFWGFCRWTGCFDKEILIALNVDVSCLTPNAPCKLSIPTGDPNGCRILGEHTQAAGGTERILAPREPADSFYEGLGAPQHRIFHDQRLFWTPEVLPGSSLQLVPAPIEQLDLLIEYTAHMRIEDEDYDPRQRDLALWKKTIAVLLSQQRILVGYFEQEICFLIEVGTRCSFGAQIGGTYVPPKFRRNGFGVRGMKGAVQHLHPVCKQISLLVNEQNLPAVSCYRKAGFLRGAAFRLIDFVF